MKKQTTGVYLLKDDKILFLVRQKKRDTRHVQGIYLPIGGHVELGEDVEDCAKREVEEESGIKINSLDLAGIVYIRGQATGETDTIMYLFTSSDFEGEAISGNEGSFEWVDRTKVDQVNLYAGDKVYLKYLLAGKFFVLDYNYKGFELIGYKVLKLLD